MEDFFGDRLQPSIIAHSIIIVIRVINFQVGSVVRSIGGSPSHQGIRLIRNYNDFGGLDCMEQTSTLIDISIHLQVNNLRNMRKRFLDGEGINFPLNCEAPWAIFFLSCKECVHQVLDCLNPFLPLGNLEGVE